MQEKVTSYEISQRLDELGYDGGSHTGWWWIDQHRDLIFIPLHEKDQWSLHIMRLVKAYDCWDLFMWADKTSPKLSKKWKQVMEEFRYALCYQPQNALGLAVIKILE